MKALSRSLQLSVDLSMAWPMAISCYTKTRKTKLKRDYARWDNFKEDFLCFMENAQSVGVVRYIAKKKSKQII